MYSTRPEPLYRQAERAQPDELDPSIDVQKPGKKAVAKQRAIRIVGTHGLATIRVSGAVARKASHLCMVLNNVMVPRRGNGKEVFALLRKEALEHPDHFTQGGLCALGDISADHC